MSGPGTRGAAGSGMDFVHPLTIGLVNNMSGARAATERQFRQLLFTAGTGLDLHFRCFCAEATSTTPGYADLDELLESDVDGIIVTGAEPQTSDLREEPLWQTVVRLVDWAEARGTPALWSCLAAHAAVRYLDGIDRQPFREKLSGVFPGATARVDHPLMQGLEPPWLMPHSRRNDLPERALESAGYSILLKSDEAGAEIFAKAGHAPFVFLQGHPEYDADTLLREFQRDWRRYQRGQCPAPPPLPRHYFSPAAAVHAAALRDLPPSAQDPREAATAALTEWGRALGPAPWLQTSLAFCRNWLIDLALRKESDAAAAREQRSVTAHQPLLALGLAP